MNNLKSKAGFTLVELIVVIVILAILAGVAVPAYNGYITKAKDAKVVSELSAVLTAAQAANATTGGTVTSITIGSDKTITVSPAGTDFNTFYGQAAFKVDLTGTSYASGATWNSTDGWKAN